VARLYHQLQFLRQAQSAGNQQKNKARAMFEIKHSQNAQKTSKWMGNRGTVLRINGESNVDPERY